MTHSLKTVPLSNLAVAEENVRKTSVDEGLEGLEANILANGVLHPLLVYPVNGKSFEVIDGQRRFLALVNLRKAKKIKPDYPVNCEIRTKEEAKSISLAANILRKNMHPADEFKAFKELADEGKSVEDIAENFGVKTNLVTRRLKLANVAPFLFEMFRKDELEINAVMAFCLTDDHKKQKAVYDALVKQDYPIHSRNVKRLITESSVSSSDKFARFVGVEAYEKAGGPITRDLFSDEVFFDDPALLETLVDKKFNDLAEALHKDGWGNVEFAIDYEYNFFYGKDELEPSQKEPSAAQAKKLKSLTAKLDRLENSDDETWDEQRDVQKQIVEIEDTLLFYTPEQKAASSVYFCLEHNGEVDYHFAVVEKSKKKTASAEKKVAPVISANLMERLTVQKNDVLKLAMLKSPDVAFDLLLETLAQNIFGNYSRTSLKVGVETASHSRDEECQHNSAASKWQEENVFWAKRFKSAKTPIKFISALKPKEKERFMSFAVSFGFDSIERNGYSVSPVRKDSVKSVSSRLSFDVADYWEPTTESFFSAIRKDYLLDMIEAELGKDVRENLSKLPKKALVVQAEDRFKGRRWLPDPLK